MSQFRKDPFGSAWVIISPERGLEPSNFGSVTRGARPSSLSPGVNDDLKELHALRPATSARNAPDWRMRVVEMPNSLLNPQSTFQPTKDDLFVSSANSGFQELIIEHPEQTMTLERMGREHLSELLKLYRDRLAYLAQKPSVRHIQLTRNVGKVAGAAYSHPYAHLLAVPVVNRWVEEECSAAQNYFVQHERCLFCAVLEAELRGKQRLVSANEHFVALTPYASKTPFETWLLPRAHASSFTSLTSNTVSHLADLLSDVVGAMNTALDDPPYNLMLHTLPSEDDATYHWHIELLPRLTTQAGFDWSSGFYVNPTPPEDAARFLKEALALQAVSR